MWKSWGFSHRQRQSGDFADSVTALQDAGATHRVPFGPRPLRFSAISAFLAAKSGRGTCHRDHRERREGNKKGMSTHETHEPHERTGDKIHMRDSPMAKQHILQDFNRRDKREPRKRRNSLPFRVFRVFRGLLPISAFSAFFVAKSERGFYHRERREGNGVRVAGSAKSRGQPGF